MTQIKKWETIVSTASRLWLKKLVYDGELILHCGAFFDDVEKEIKVSFGERPIYRDIQEEYFVPLWKNIFSSPNRIGWTFVLEQSQWLEDLNKDEIFSETMKTSKHYVISMEDDVVEVITKNEPVFTVVF